MAINYCSYISYCVSLLTETNSGNNVIPTERVTGRGPGKVISVRRRGHEAKFKVSLSKRGDSMRLSLIRRSHKCTLLIKKNKHLKLNHVVL
jgi:hypothetical protein